MGRMTPFIKSVDDHSGVYQSRDDAAKKDYQKQIAKRPA